MDREIILDTPTKYAHTQFVAWLNDLLINYVTGFWDAPVKALLNVSFLKESQLFFQELYGPNGDEYMGFFVVITSDSLDQWLLVFDVDGQPTHYIDSGINTIFEVSQGGILTRFWPNNSLNLDTGDRFIAVYYEEWFGVKFPMVYIKLTDGTPIAKGLLDTLYEGRTSGTYTCRFWPEDTVDTYLVTNLTSAMLKLQVPLSDTHLEPYTVSPNGTTLIPKTTQSDYYLRELKKLGTIKFRLYAN